MPRPKPNPRPELSFMRLCCWQLGIFSFVFSFFVNICPRKIRQQQKKHTFEKKDNDNLFKSKSTKEGKQFFSSSHIGRQVPL